MEQVKFKDVVVGETYIGGSGNEHKILAKYYDPMLKTDCVVTLRSNGSMFYTATYTENQGTNFLYRLPLSLAEKFNRFRQSRGSGSGQEYWKGLEAIAQEHFSRLISK